MSDSVNVRFLFWAGLSICSSVGIILTNKTIMNTFGFQYPFSLTSLHFLVQAGVFQLLSKTSLFEVKKMPFYDNVLTSAFGVGSIVFMNFNLKANSVGFYQMTKLLCIPLMVFIQSKYYGVEFSRKIKLTLFIVLFGVGIAVVSDLGVSVIGIFLGALAVFFTTQFQIWQGSKRTAHELSSLQCTHSVSFPMFLICSACAIMYEFPGEDSCLSHSFQTIEVMFIFLSCCIAVSVNLCSFTLIGLSSPVTYQIIGHFKTMLVLLGGIVLFPFTGSSTRLTMNLFGIAIAMFGVILYGNVKEAEKNNAIDLIDVLKTNIMGQKENLSDEEFETQLQSY